MKIRVSIVILLSIILCLLTNSPGNILIVIGIYTNLPHYKSKRFAYLMSVGIFISITL